MKFALGVIVHARSSVTVAPDFACQLKSEYLTSPFHTHTATQADPLYVFNTSFVVSYQTIHSVGLAGADDDIFTSFSDMFQPPNNDVLFIVLILVQLTSVSCFLYTCASVATAVHVFVASVVLLGTTGLVPNVLVPLIV